MPRACSICGHLSGHLLGCPKKKGAPQGPATTVCFTYPVVRLGHKLWQTKCWRCGAPILFDFAPKRPKACDACYSPKPAVEVVKVPVEELAVLNYDERAEFERDLKEQAAPTPEVQALPLRMIL